MQVEQYYTLLLEVIVLILDIVFMQLNCSKLVY